MQHKNLKHFYLHHVQKYLTHLFPNTVSYNRFVELSQQVVLPMTLFLKMQCLGNCTGITYVDSTSIRVCKNKRIKSNKVFKGIVTVGKSTMGWFYGFKLHLIVNEKNFIANLISGLIAYSFFPKKPAIKFDVESTNQLAIY